MRKFIFYIVITLLCLTICVLTMFFIAKKQVIEVVENKYVGCSNQIVEFDHWHFSTSYTLTFRYGNKEEMPRFASWNLISKEDKVELSIILCNKCLVESTFHFPIKTQRHY